MTMTRTALSGAADMGMTRQDMENVIRALTRKDFYKSTTTFHDHRIWMDVYHGRAEDYEIYIKLSKSRRSVWLLAFRREMLGITSAAAPTHSRSMRAVMYC